MRIFSGIQPTGRKHLGNYLGAIRQYVSGQDRGEGIYCVVDLHAITIAYKPEDLRKSVYDTTAMLLAAGLDPERCILFRQGDVREHTELCWHLASVTAFGELSRMTQFKDKSAKQDLVKAGLFLYPVLQAADILLYQTDEVPVGEDQRQHIELTRDVAMRFNETFGKTFVVPKHVIPTIAARVMDLKDPTTKMSTSARVPDGVVHVLDEEAATLKKFKGATTDSGSEVKRGDDKPGVSNLIEIYAAVRGVAPDAVEQEFVGKRYGDFKLAVGDAVNQYFKPVREKYVTLRADEAELERVLGKGAEKARAIAVKTMQKVRDAMGLKV
ncbi:MAG: tryptophan--tRNA ligase [Deltaproteobacteria bacterium]|nr:tryptophan--tRNA ligase [Deltaproteobacteria bacterium]